MSSTFLVILALCAAPCGCAAIASHAPPSKSAQDLKSSWLQTSSTANPVTRVVNLLKEMSATLEKEMADDEALYHKLMCWCHDGKYEKEQEVEAAQNKIAALESEIEKLTALSAELTSSIKEIQEKVAADKATLAEATKIREEQAKKFFEENKDAIESLENLKAAIEVLSKHEGAAFPQTNALSLIQEQSFDTPWAAGHESQSERSMDDFLRNNDMNQAVDDSDAVPATVHPHATSQFLQHKESAPTPMVNGWSAHETFVVRRAMKAATVFMQRHGQQYYPAYTFQSGEIMGILRQLKEQMTADLGDAQKIEAERAANFHELREAKTAEIEAGEAMEERKEDELATTNNDLANAKEDLKKTQDVLSETQTFLMNLGGTCDDATKNFEKRKADRLAEIQAVAETIGILTSDEARDNFKATYSFVQKTATKQQRQSLQRTKAAALLRRAAAKAKMPALLTLATSVELDAFTKVKAAIDEMLAMLTQQMKDEVKKNDWCKEEIQETEMNLKKKHSLADSLTAKIAELEGAIKQLEDEISAGKSEIATLQLELQKATEDRIAESKEFQKTIADQRMTQGILKQALERLATFYDNESFIQRGKQTPPGPPMMEYKKNEGSTGVMQMIEKIIYEARDLEKATAKGEQEATAAYEALIAETNGSVAALQKEVVSKTKAKGEAVKDKRATEEDLADTEKEIDGLFKYEGDLHGDCDYLLKNFNLRQEARQQEIDALNQAKAILSGAKFAE